MTTFKFFYIPLIIFGFIIFCILSYIYVPKFTYSSDRNYSVAMSGRSVMKMWFKYWNIPQILNNISIYKEWPVPYSKFVSQGVYYKYLPLEAPHRGSDNENYKFGKAMVDSLMHQIDNDKYDALFFKFCFVDFADKRMQNRQDADRRYKEMINVVKDVYAYTNSHSIKLILGNSMPSLNPNPFSQETRYHFNEWIENFAKNNDDVWYLDMFNTLSDENGKLKKAYSIDLADNDSHLTKNATHLLEVQLYSIINELKKQ